VKKLHGVYSPMMGTNPPMLIIGNPKESKMKTKGGLFHYPKGSLEARAYMAKLRGMRGKKNPLTQEEASELHETSYELGNEARVFKKGSKSYDWYEARSAQAHIDANKYGPKSNPPMLVIGNPGKTSRRAGGKPAPVGMTEEEYVKATGAKPQEYVVEYSASDGVLKSFSVLSFTGKMGMFNAMALGNSYLEGQYGRGGDYHITYVSPKGVRKNPGNGIPAHIWNDPQFQSELRAYKTRHGTGPVEIRKIKVPKGFPKFMSVYGQAPHAVYDAPSHSNKGKRIHHFGKRGKNRPWLVSSSARGPKFLAYVGGQFKAKPSWIYD